MTKEETRRGAESVEGPSKKRKQDGSAGGDRKGKRKAGEVGNFFLIIPLAFHGRAPGVHNKSGGV